ncbi:MAG: prepilin-type N-terminal cleavage/methylation domain-containing protein [Candidatus Riflebacteria bacterium]|nr:prepilin-type N-terminal cleavage/methylation domain-containing protein [Candidatus Riflebacteria bacterium]
MSKHNHRRRRPGFTMVEMIVTMAIGILVFMMVSRFLTGTRFQFMHGTVNLQNLQDARLAINHLRRDFSSATIFFGSTYTKTTYKTVRALQARTFSQPTVDPANPTEKLISIKAPHQIAFYRFTFETAGEKPTVERVQYRFDPAAKTLTRTSPSRSIEFKGFEDVEFRLYCHGLNPDVPLLWARFLIHEGEEIYGKADIGKALELTTTISSPFLTSSLQNLSWNFETHQVKK